ncbi:MAG: iron-sulfur cluster assembly protein, partial [Candidatus Dadabacteria bacterium]|nr:iron-sulfur cluster assembly protein [Candidatus Dadabacteria bacterium]
MEITQEGVRSVLKKVRYPGFTRDIVSFGIVKDVKVDGGRVSVSLVLPKPDQKLETEIGESVRSALLETPGVSGVDIQIAAREPKAAPGQGPAKAEAPSKLPAIKHYIAVA